MLVSTLPFALATLLLCGSVHALGDFPCAGTSDSQSCAAWSIDTQRQGDISPNATCQPDPVHPSVSYCGYANAPCTTALDCDYGSCGSNGQCKGYAGDACPNGQIDCQGFFFCGTDGKCRGTGAPCANGLVTSPIPSPDDQCLSGTCNLNTTTCAAPPAEGMPIGSGCGQNSNCASGHCATGTAKGGNLCAQKITASQRARAKRAVGPDGNDSCLPGHTACSVGSAYSDAFECIDASTNLEQCGGCVSNGVGQDCTAILGVESVTCKQGTCVVVSCMPGMSVSRDGTSCVSQWS